MSAPSLDAAPPRGPGTPPEARRFPKIDQDSQPDTETFDSAPAIPGDHQDPDVPAGEDVDTAGLETTSSPRSSRVNRAIRVRTFAWRRMPRWSAPRVVMPRAM